MASERTKQKWGLTGRYTPDEQEESVIDLSPAAKRERTRCKKDLKYFYQRVLARGVTDKRTGRSHANTLGKIHDLFIDFLTFEMADQVKSHSDLFRHLPAKTDGNYGERWLYWRRLNLPPDVQDGPDGPISDIFYKGEQIWRGVIIRVCGDGLTKACLMPRGHLKSTLGNMAYSMWQIIREPWSRELVRSYSQALANNFVGNVKYHFEQNEKFRRLFGDMGPPPKRDGVWKNEMLQVRSEFGWKSCDKEPTIWSVGMTTEINSAHFERILLDDVVGEKNTKTKGELAKANETVQNMQALLDPGGLLHDIGTLWAEDDPHRQFTARDSEMAEDCSFMVATVLDDDQKPIWPEKFTLRDIAKIRRGMPEDRRYYGQYYNQFTGTTAKTFSPQWITNYEGDPQEVVAQAKNGMDIYFGVDAASGEEKQEGRLDYTAGVVLGQTHDRKRVYLLDGFCERLPAEGIAEAIVDTAMKWKKLTPAGSTFRVGCEATVYTNFLHVALQYLQRQRGLKALFNVEPLKHNNVSKRERIRVLARPYAEHCILWPRELIVAPFAQEMEPYDFRQMLEKQFRAFPGVMYDDILDAHAYAYQLCRAMAWAEDEAPAKPIEEKGSYRRQPGGDHEEKRSLGGYDTTGGRLSL